MKLKIKHLFFAIAAYLLPLTVSAQVPDLGIDDNIPSARGTFTLTDLLATGNRIVDIFVSIIVVLSVLSIIWGGFSFVTSGGDEEKTKAARNRIMYGIIGIAVIILAGAIFAFVGSIIA